MPSTRTPAIQQLADRLHSASIHLLRRLRTEDVRTGIGPARLSALSVVVFAGPLSLGDLARAEQVKPPTMSRIVAGLEDAGLVRREPDRKDRRAIRIRATAAGRRVLERGRRRRVERLARELSSLSAAERKLLGRAAEVLSGLGRQRSPSRRQTSPPCGITRSKTTQRPSGDHDG